MKSFLFVAAILSVILLADSAEAGSGRHRARRAIRRTSMARSSVTYRLTSRPVFVRGCPASGCPR